MESTKISAFPQQDDYGVKKSLEFSCVKGEIEVLFQQTFLKNDCIPELPVIEDGPFVYQIVRGDGVIICHSIIDFFSTPRTNAFAHATSTMDDTVADHGTAQHIVELLSVDDVEARGSGSQSSSHSDYQETIIPCYELIEVDQLIKLGDDSILRLADHSGWVAAQFGNEVAARKVGVERGIWSWCADNYPDGLTIRSHPMDSSELLPSERNQIRQRLNRRLLPLQQIYCDMRVKHPTTGVMFYRLQSSSVGHGGEYIAKQAYAPFQQVLSKSSTETEWTAEDEYTIVSSLRDRAKMTFQAAVTFASQGWVFDRSRAPMGVTDSDISERRWLIDDNLIQLNQFVIYQALSDDLFVQSHTDVTYDSQRIDDLRIKNGDMVVVRVIRHSPDFEKHGNGPFLYLADGSGWLYEHRNHHPVMKVVPLAKGCWECVVQNNPAGVRMLRHPLDAQEGFFAGEVVFPHDSVIQCDRKVTNEEKGISFYRVLGSEGWIPDKISTKVALEILSCSSPDVTENLESKFSSANGWTADFIRGILATEPSYHEENYEENSCVVTFIRTDEKVDRLNIFLKTQTVIYTSIPSKSDPMSAKIQKCKRNCSAKDLLEIIQNPCILGRDEMVLREEKKEVDAVDLIPTHYYISDREKEEELRQQLLACDNEINILTTSRRNLLRQVTLFDEERAVELRKILKFYTAETSKSENTHRQNDHANSCQEYRKCSSSSQDTDKRNEDDLETLSCSVDSGDNAHDGIQSSASISTASKIFGFLRTASNINGVDSQVSENVFDVRIVRASRSGISDSASAMMSVGSSRKQFFCGECHRTFNGKYSRDIHCREIHGLICTTCDKNFESRKQLIDHVQRKHRTAHLIT